MSARSRDRWDNSAYKGFGAGGGYGRAKRNLAAMVPDRKRTPRDRNGNKRNPVRP